MANQTPDPAPSIWSRLPSFVWLILIIGGIAALIGGIFGLFYALTHFEGLASVLMLLVAWGVIRWLSGGNTATETSKNSGQQIFIAIGILFFALMGVAIDQPGNVIYNQPIEWLFCPAGSTLERGVVTTNPRPGETSVNQDFTCVAMMDDRLQTVDRPAVEEVLVTRLVEYVLIGYLLLGLSQLYNVLRRARAAGAD